MFKHLKKYKTIVVSGPQRSGTTICGKMIAHDTGYKYLDEEVFWVHDKNKWLELCKQENVVIQCPTMCRYLEEISRDDLLVVIMKRKLKDILTSQQRIGWLENEIEIRKYGYSKGQQAEIKYEYWKKQRENIKSWIEVRYSSLKKHPMWVDKELRKNFTAKQTNICQ